MSELKTYRLVVNGHPTVMRLSDADAAAYGDGAVLVDESTVDTKRREPQNKSRRPVAKTEAE